MIKGIKICKCMLEDYKGKRFIQIRMTFLGYLLRNRWVICESDFKGDYLDRWIPCYMSFKNLIGIKNKYSKYRVKENE